LALDNLEQDVFHGVHGRSEEGKRKQRRYEGRYSEDRSMI
jgi:hypothetical protein